jgi:hypothetical protein
MGGYTVCTCGWAYFFHCGRVYIVHFHGVKVLVCRFFLFFFRLSWFIIRSAFFFFFSFFFFLFMSYDFHKPRWSGEIRGTGGDFVYFFSGVACFPWGRPGESTSTSRVPRYNFETSYDDRICL